MDDGPIISREQIKILVSHFLEKQGFKSFKEETAGDCQIYRIGPKNGAIVGSITIAPSVLMPIAQAQKYIQALVLDALRACISEPGARNG